jgi:hypothetical protein
MRQQSKWDYRLCSNHVVYGKELALLALVGFVVMRRALILATEPIFGSSPQRNAFHTAQDWHLRLVTPSGSFPVRTFHGDCLSCPARVPNGAAFLEITTHTGGIRRAAVTLDTKSRTFAHKNMTVVPTTVAARHYIARYLLRDSVICPQKPVPTAAWFDHETGEMIDLSTPKTKRRDLKA